MGKQATRDVVESDAAVVARKDQTLSSSHRLDPPSQHKEQQ